MQERANPQWNMVALARRIQPNSGELVTARKHLFTVRRRLSTAFDISRIILIGSHSRGTAVRWYSDLDVLVVLRRNEAKWGRALVTSSTLVGRVRDDLQERYVQTDIRRDQQAVVLGFATGQQSLDVVPGLFRRFEKLRPIYWIPDGSGGWLETSPEAHNVYFNNADERSGGKLKKLIQLLKWWKFSRAQPAPLQSFHLDLLLASSGICIGVKPYTHCLYEAFKLLADRECRGVHDPLEIAGTVLAVQTEPQWEAANKAVSFALDHARAALAAEVVKDFAEANRQWNIVFNGEF